MSELELLRRALVKLDELLALLDEMPRRPAAYSAVCRLHGVLLQRLDALERALISEVQR